MTYSAMAVVRDRVNPKLYLDWSPPSDFQLVPIDVDGKIIQNIDLGNFDSRADYLRALRSDINWATVAIRCCETGSFMSCRRSTYIPGIGWTCLTEYRTSIGKFEQFKLQFHPETGAYTFKTHNNCYLDANRTFYTLASRPAPKNGWWGSSQTKKTIASARSWLISPKLKISSNQERILFIGAYDESQFWNQEMELRAECELLDNGDHLTNDYFTLLRKWLRGPAPKNYPDGGWTEWTKFEKFHRYVRVKQSEEEDAPFKSFIIVTTENFSRSMCLECMNELMDIHLKYSQLEESTTKYLEENKMNRNESIRKDLQHLMWKYDVFNEEAPLNTKLKEAMEAIDENVDKIKKTMVTTEDVLASADELEKQCKLFQKRAKSLKRSVILISGGIGLTAGAALGLLIGEPITSIAIGTQIAEVSVGAITGLVSGLGASVPGSVYRKVWTVYRLPPNAGDF